MMIAGEDSFYDDEQENCNDITYDELKLQHEMEESLQSGENYDEYYDDDNIILIDSDDDNNLLNGTNNNQMELDDKPFSCELCQKKVSTSYNLKRHMMIHTGEKPYGCDLCEKRFREFSDLKKHRKKHTSEVHFKCMVCNINSPSPFDPTKCVKCLNADGYGIRMNSVGQNIGPHISAKRNIYQQPNQYRIQQNLHRQLQPQQQKQHHQLQQQQRMVKIRNPDIPRFEGNKRAYICTFCDRVFGSSSNLKRHVMIHTGEKPYDCNVCNRAFRELSTLRKHQATHFLDSGSGGIDNDLASSSSSNSTLSSTTNYNNDSMQYFMGKDIQMICKICYKCFKSKEHLRSHMLTHRN